MTVTVKIDDTAFKAYVRRTLKAMPQEIDRALSITSQQGINVILDRTEKGKQIGGGAFKPYSPEYARSKSSGWPRTKTRRAFSGDPSGDVNLMVSGNMLSSISQRRVKKGVREIYFTRATAARKAFFNNKSRPFFGFSQKEVNRLSNVFKKALFR